ncbi:aminoglycoside phosphotransferase family protein [Simkania sp.]|uniref:aminoglycoside phosphotransferase family protein n=1 Tax=Simkania sp. TaxID=34094 RepID=UPI003B5286A2
MHPINTELAESLVASQFPKWKDLSIQPIENDGWDHRTFRLGNELLLRFPSAECYAAQVKKEHAWLPRLASLLPLPIPTPLAMGKPSENYHWTWSVYRYIEGTPASIAPITDFCMFATQLAEFLIALEKIDPKNGPPPGPHCFHRGGSLKVYDSETRQALEILKDQINSKKAHELWDAAIATEWKKPSVWVHGDMNASNLLIENGRLSAVIDFGMLNVGDPACDLAIAWTFFEGESREAFLSAMPFDHETLLRGKAWTLWKALIVAAGLSHSNAINAFPVLNTLLES